MFSISDPSALAGQGYVFKIGYEANIRDNMILTTNYTRVTVTFDDEQPQSALQDFSSAAGLSTQFCDERQRNSGESTLRVFHAGTYQPLAHIALGYVCGGELCSLGSTNDAGEYVGRLPICAGGFLTASSVDFASTSVPLSTSLDEVAQVDDILLLTLI